MTLANKILQRLEETGQNQSEVARKIGVSPQSIQALVKGKTLAPKFPDRLAKVLGVTTEWLMGDEHTQLSAPDITEIEKPKSNKGSPSPRKIPIINHNNGYFDGANDVNNQIVGYIPQLYALENHLDLYAVYVKGDSMAPKHINGDIALVSPHLPYTVGESVIVCGTPQGQNNKLSVIRTFEGVRVIDGVVTMVFEELENPEQSKMYFTGENIISIHKILTTREMLGV